MVVVLAGLASSSVFAEDVIGETADKLSAQMDAGVKLGKFIVNIGALTAACGAFYNFQVEKTPKALITAAIGLAVAGAGGAILAAAKGIAGS